MWQADVRHFEKISLADQVMSLLYPEMVPQLSKEVLTEFHQFSEMSAE